MELLKQLNSTAHLRDVIKSLPRTGRYFSMRNTTKKGDRKWLVNLSPPKVEIKKLIGVKRDTSHLNIIRVWERNAKGFRTVNANTVYEITFGGYIYTKNKEGIWSAKVK